VLPRQGQTRTLATYNTLSTHQIAPVQQLQDLPQARQNVLVYKQLQMHFVSDSLPSTIEGEVLFGICDSSERDVNTLKVAFIFGSEIIG